MEDSFTEARAQVEALDRAVAAGDTRKDRRLWGGAGLGIVAQTSDIVQNADHRYVVTLHAATLSWLIRSLWEGSQPLLDSMTKLEFFGRLGNAAQRYQKRVGGNERPSDLLGAVVHEAYEILADIEGGRFYALPVAPSGVVHDDILPDSAHSDGPSSTEIEKWFGMGGPK